MKLLKITVLFSLLIIFSQNLFAESELESLMKTASSYFRQHNYKKTVEVSGKILLDAKIKLGLGTTTNQVDQFEVSNLLKGVPAVPFSQLRQGQTTDIMRFMDDLYGNNYVNVLNLYRRASYLYKASKIGLITKTGVLKPYKKNQYLNDLAKIYYLPIYIYDSSNKVYYLIFADDDLIPSHLTEDYSDALIDLAESSLGEESEAFLARAKEIRIQTWNVFTERTKNEYIAKLTKQGVKLCAPLYGEDSCTDEELVKRFPKILLMPSEWYGTCITHFADSFTEYLEHDQAREVCRHLNDSYAHCVQREYPKYYGRKVPLEDVMNSVCSFDLFNPSERS